ncbi:hypothetical protein Tco_0929283 [Tanacetum coccineum]
MLIQLSSLSLILLSPLGCMTHLMEEIDLFLTSDDSMPPGIESDDYDSKGDIRFLDELLNNDSLPLPENGVPVAAVTNDFDVLNNDESFDSGEGENVDSLNVEEEDSFTFTIRSFLPFVTYPEVLPTFYSTGSEDKVFNPGIFEKDAFKDKSSKELASSKALLTLDVFDPLHPPLMDFHVTKAFSGFTFSLLKIFSKKFSGFWKIHGSILWKDKAMPTISIDDLQSSLHKVGNLLSFSLSINIFSFGHDHEFLLEIPFDLIFKLCGQSFNFSLGKDILDIDLHFTATLG